MGDDKHGILKSGLMGIGSQVAGGLLGMATAGWQDKRQVRQQKKLQEIEIGGSKRMAQFNKDLALQQWKDTSYGAQRKELEKAGLNVGLMYGQAGAGGTTQGASGSVTGASASGGSGEVQAGMGLGLQSAMSVQQMDLMRAQAELARAQAKKTGGIDTELGHAGLQKLYAETDNEVLKGEIMKVDKRIQDVILKVKEATSDAEIETVWQESLKAGSETQRSLIAQGMEREVAVEIVKQEQLATISAGLENALTRSKLSLNKMQLDVMAETILKIKHDKSVDFEQLTQKDKEIAIKKELQKFQTNVAEKAKQGAGAVQEWVNIPLSVYDRIIKMVDAIMPL